MKQIDTHGREYSTDHRFTGESLDISEVPSGLYILVLITENGIITKKIEKF